MPLRKRGHQAPEVYVHNIRESGHWLIIDPLHRQNSVTRRATLPFESAASTPPAISSVHPKASGTSFLDMSGKDPFADPKPQTSKHVTHSSGRQLPPIPNPVPDQEIDALKKEIEKNRKDGDGLRAEIQNLSHEYAHYRVNLQHQEALEPSQLLAGFRALNRSIEDLCRDFSEYVMKRPRFVNIKDPTTEHIANPKEFFRLVPEVEKRPSLYWSAAGRPRPLEDTVDYALRTIINRELCKRIFDPFHPSLCGRPADGEIKRTYGAMRRASTQIPCGRWRALSFQYLDKMSPESTRVARVARDDIEKRFLAPFFSSLVDEPKRTFLSPAHIGAFEGILSAAYDWNCKAKSQFVSLDYHVSLPGDRLFDEQSMQYLEKPKNVAEPSRMVVAAVAMGLESSEARESGDPPYEVWQEKITVLTEDYFHSS